ncbi:FOG: Transposon-encoded proteins with TYA, reverse transcriptase, integrase domains in various combinations [Plasmopara halstedii]|uniref:FOG: Transposon-encoded proteins with TYA, reverse transcriptase, integrase domains in various combinations n=1 Tax=Plasmopara halstedii TaxID=4781 RepID=A0A0P1AMG5_PLAHL|nr:FOG: Transposon-encoded proteins with TYA, reverse transcriptase, integrase domains in various combinations [Plasmopara halstedii]CEG42337.1 FOG: Transposon-encoded proteins with TYA, reverse transcriptase, integrase domains in various combinations [Plasmopara halstedii]|eukprot:XP_024578706.1 FOG: Transposon-encoded proteins with TYA, reverse transcriptase, integrase domains in various combinations [Plasmopara halstedii]
MDHLSVFDSHGYAHINDVKRPKLEPKSFKSMFLGYAENVKGYRVFDLKNAKINVNGSAKLDEREMGGICDTQEVKPDRIIQVMKDGDEVKVQYQVDRQPVLDDPMEVVEEPVADVELDDIDHAPSIDVQRLMHSESPVINRLELMEYHQPTQVQHEDRLVFRPEVERTIARRELVLKIRNGSVDEESERGHGSHEKRFNAQLDHDGFFPRSMIKMAMSCDTNTTGRKRIQAKAWRRLFRDLFSAGRRYGFFQQRVDGQRFYGSSARCQQYQGLCQLKKAIYGLKHAASAWKKMIHRVFVGNGFKSCGADQCVYVKSTNKGFVHVELYLDDMIIAARTSEEINQVKDVLKNAYKMKELGKAEFILGWKSITTGQLEL